MDYKTLFIISIIASILTSCGFKKETPITIALNPWPGYEFLYLAEKMNFFEAVDLNVKLLQLGSLSDARRAYVNGNADGFASTIIESVQAEIESSRPLKIVLVPDYSNGGDVIVSAKNITGMQDLKGKTVGCEVDSLGIYILQRALSLAGLELSDVELLNVEQMRAEQAMKEKKIDAYVSYPPVSVNLLKNPKYHTIFTSAEIPNEIIDAVSVSQETLDNHPQLVTKLRKAWQMSLDYYQSNTKEAVDIMSTRERITPDDFVATLSDLKILDTQQQTKIFAAPKLLRESILNVCNTLVHVNAIKSNCSTFPDIIYQENTRMEANR